MSCYYKLYVACLSKKCKCLTDTIHKNFKTNPSWLNWRILYKIEIFSGKIKTAHTTLLCSNARVVCYHVSLIPPNVQINKKTMIFRVLSFTSYRNMFSNKISDLPRPIEYVNEKSNDSFLLSHHPLKCRS